MRRKQREAILYHWRGDMIVINFFIPAIFHTAAHRGCARAVHAAIHVAAENDTFENTSNSSSKNSKCCDLAPKAAT